MPRVPASTVTPKPRPSPTASSPAARSAYCSAISPSSIRKATSLHALGRLLLPFWRQARLPRRGRQQRRRLCRQGGSRAGGLNAAAMLKIPATGVCGPRCRTRTGLRRWRPGAGRLGKAAVTVVLTPFKTQAMLDYAAVLLPSALSETSGTFVNTEGRVQSFTPPQSRWAMPVRPGRCCACWATCSSRRFRLQQQRGRTSRGLGGKPEFVAGLDNDLNGVAMSRTPKAPASSASPMYRSILPILWSVARRPCNWQRIPRPRRRA
jgi:hypothetical protein